MLVVDQFEELFTQCADEGERRAFIAALHAAATTGQGTRQVPAALVVLVVRADIEARCADYPEAASAVQDRYLLTPMTERQLRLAVSEPAGWPGPPLTRRWSPPSCGRCSGGSPAAPGPRARVSCRCCLMPWTRPGAAVPAAGG